MPKLDRRVAPYGMTQLGLRDPDARRLRPLFPVAHEILTPSEFRNGDRPSFADRFKTGIFSFQTTQENARRSQITWQAQPIHRVMARTNLKLLQRRQRLLSSLSRKPSHSK